MSRPIHRALMLTAALLAVHTAAPSARAASQETPAPAATSSARGTSQEAALLRACILGAARLHNVPPAGMVVLLLVEGGKLGMRSGNTNGTGDLGPWQINEIWIPKLAARWGLPQDETHRLVRDDLCANADAAGWIFGLNLRDVRGDLWEGVARYHSMRVDLQDKYLTKALRAAQSLRQLPKPEPGR